MDEKHDPKADVNPAARHDSPTPPPAPEQRAREEREQVKPAQDQPLDPLAPGGIGG